MLTTSQRERILSHIQHGWKLPDSLVVELWEAYEALEQNCHPDFPSITATNFSQPHPGDSDNDLSRVHPSSLGA